jgi:hypothetical protein
LYETLNYNILIIIIIMRFSTSILFSAVCLSTITSAYDNNPPIPERHPGWSYGAPLSGVEIELVYDLSCSDCAYFAPLF